MKISWSPTARLTYFKVLDYIYKQWTINEVENFNISLENTKIQ